MKTVITEREFQAQILTLAGYAGWRCYHTFDSRRSAAGFPDLVLVNPERGLLVFAELKTDAGKLRPEQREWLEALSRCERVESRLWRPGMWPEIEETLCKRTRQRRRGA